MQSTGSTGVRTLLSIGWSRNSAVSQPALDQKSPWPHPGIAAQSHASKSLREFDATVPWQPGGYKGRMFRAAIRATTAMSWLKS